MFTFAKIEMLTIRLAFRSFFTKIRRHMGFRRNEIEEYQLINPIHRQCDLQTIQLFINVISNRKRCFNLILFETISKLFLFWWNNGCTQLFYSHCKSGYRHSRNLLIHFWNTRQNDAIITIFFGVLFSFIHLCCCYKIAFYEQQNIFNRGTQFHNISGSLR